MASCISDSTADGFLSNRLDIQQRNALLAHLDECRDCRNALLQRLISASTLQGEDNLTLDEGLSAVRELSETREWFAGRSPEDMDLQSAPPTLACEPVRAIVEQSLARLPPLSSPTERCQKCMESGVSELGRLKVERRLGEGGSSIVYLAYDTVLKRQVALKLPRGPGLANPNARERFLREAQAAGLLRHPNIVPIYGAGEVGGSFHITLAYCSGPTLAEWLKQRRCGISDNEGSVEQASSRENSTSPVSAATAAWIVTCLADAVDHAYQSGVLHRDIKPGNILLEPREKVSGDEFPYTPMLSDFGLAFLADEQSDLTLTGTVVGTPRYMAPEQVTGQHDQLGPATDVYGLGTVLYELLVGQAPVQGGSHAETLMRVTVAEPELPRRIVPGIPRDLEAICLKCLRKSPAQRYRTAAELAEDLRRFQGGEPTLARPVTQWSRAIRWSRRHPGITALVLLLVAAVALLVAAQGFYNWRLDRLNSELSESLDQTVRARELTEQSEIRTQELLYASDMRLATEAWQDLDLRQYHQLLDRHRPGPGERDFRGLEWDYLWHMGHVESASFGVHEGGVYFTRYSPDGQWIVTAGEDGVVRVYDARNCQSVMELPTGQGEVNGVAFAPDGQRMATAGDDGTVRVWDVQSREELLRIAAHEDLAYQVVFAGDGCLVSCGNEPNIRIWDAKTGEPSGVLEGHSDTVEAIELAPDGRQLVSVSMDETARIWDLQMEKEAQILHRYSRPVKCVAISQDGALVATGTKAGEVIVFDTATYEPVARLHHLDIVHGVALSSNGGLVAVADAGGMVALWRIPSKVSDGKHELTEPVIAWAAHSGRAWSVVISPNGDSLLSTGSDGKVRLCRTSTSLGWRNLNLRESGQFDSQPRTRRWLTAVPGSSKLVAAVDTKGLLLWDPPDTPESDRTSPDVPSLAQNGGMLPKPIVLEEGGWTVSHVSADGRFAAGGNVDGDAAVWDLSSGKRRAIWSLDSSRAMGGVALSPDGSKLAAYHLKALWLLDPGQRAPVQRFELEDCRHALFSPDGSRLVLGDGNVAVVIDVMQPGRRLTLQGHSSTVRCVAISPDGRFIAAGSNDRTVNLWNATTGEVVLSLHGHRGQVAEVIFAPDGRSLVTADSMGTLKLWHVASGQELCVLDEVPSGYTGIGFLREGQGLICSYGRHEVRVLEWGKRE